MRPASTPISHADPADVAIAELYRSASRTAPSAFRHFALQRARALIPFDGALWGTGAVTSRHFHTCTLIGLPEEFVQILEDTLDVNPMFEPILAQLDLPLDRREVLDDAHYFTSEIYQRCFARFGISHILSTAHVDPDSGVYSLITLYRRDRSTAFTDLERSRQARLVYHLVNAASHAFFLNLNSTYGRRRQDSGAAVIDSQGLFHEAQARFFELLDSHFPGHAPRALPFALPPEGETATVNGVCIATDRIAPQLRRVHIWPAGPLDALTARERDVVYAVAHGLSFKQVARKLGIAPSTVANHLYRVYEKLHISGRTELARLVYPEIRDEGSPR